MTIIGMVLVACLAATQVAWIVLISRQRKFMRDLSRQRQALQDGQNDLIRERLRLAKLAGMLSERHLK